VVAGNFAAANIIGIASFIALVALLYGWMLRRGAVAR
jgi:hypothetical protein